MAATTNRSKNEGCRELATFRPATRFGTGGIRRGEQLHNGEAHTK